MGRTSTAERTAMDQPASQARHRTGRPLRVKDNPSNPSSRVFSGPLFVSKETCADLERTAMDQPASQARHRTGRPLRVKDNPSNPSSRVFSGPLFVSKETCAD